MPCEGQNDRRQYSDHSDTKVQEEPGEVVLGPTEVSVSQIDHTRDYPKKDDTPENEEGEQWLHISFCLSRVQRRASEDHSLSDPDSSQLMDFLPKGVFGIHKGA